MTNLKDLAYLLMQGWDTFFFFSIPLKIRMCDPVLRAEPSIGWDDNGAPRLNDYLFVGELKQTQNGQRQRASIQRHDINK